MSQLPAAVIKLTEQIENATGINILSGLARRPAVETAAEQPAAAEQTAPD